MTLHVHSTQQTSRSDAVYQLAFSEFLRRTMSECADLHVAERDDAFDAFFAEFAGLSQAEAIVMWTRSVDQSWSRKALWIGDKTELEAVAAAIGPYGDRGSEWTGMTQPVILDIAAAPADIRVVGHDGVPNTTHLLVPVRPGEETGCVLAVSRNREIVWLEHEIAATAELASIFWKTRERLAVEAQLSTSFYAAPLGLRFVPTMAF